MYTVYKIILHSPKLMRRTFPKEPCPSTFRSSNCCGSAFSEPSLTRCVMQISLTDTSSWREDDNNPERELHQRETQTLWQTVQTNSSKPEKRSPAREKALLLNSPQLNNKPEHTALHEHTAWICGRKHITLTHATHITAVRRCVPSVLGPDLGLVTPLHAWGRRGWAPVESPCSVRLVLGFWCTERAGPNSVESSCDGQLPTRLPWHHPQSSCSITVAVGVEEGD